MKRLLLAFIVAIPSIARADLADDRASLREAVSMTKGLKPYESWVKMMEKVGEAQGRCGDRDAAHQTFSVVIDAVVGINDPQMTWQFWAILAESQARAGLADDVRRSVDQFRKAPKIFGKTLSQDKNAGAERFITRELLYALIKIEDYPAGRDLARSLSLDNTDATDKEKADAKRWVESSLAEIDYAETMKHIVKGDPEARKRAIATFLERAKAADKPAAADKAYSDLSAAQAKAGDIAGAKSSADRIAGQARNFSPRAVSLLVIAALQNESGDRAGAAETARAALKLTRAVKVTSPRKYQPYLSFPENSIAESIGVIAEVESPEVALKLVDELDGPMAKLQAWLAIAKLLADRKDLDAARALCDQAEKIVPDIDDPATRTGEMDQVLTTRIRLHLTADPEAAIKAISPKRRDGARVSLMMNMAREGDCAKALKAASTLESTFMKDYYPSLIAKTATEGGHADKILQLARVAKTDKERCQLLEGLADGIIHRLDGSERKARKLQP